MLSAKLKITIIVDNYIDLFLPDFRGLQRTKPGTTKKPLMAGHGLSILIELFAGQHYKLLMDASHSLLVLKNNLEALSINPATIDGILLSHAHPDHFGGLIGFIKEVCSIKKDKIDLFIGKDAEFPKSFKTPKNEIGPWLLEFKSLEDAGANIIQINDCYTITDSIYASGVVEKTNAFEQIMDGALRQVKGNKEPDPFTDENSVFIPTGDGVVVVSSCSHRGIINIIGAAKKMTRLPLRAVIGGFHLGLASTDVIDRTVAALKKENPEWVIAGHCTGIKAHCKLMNELDGYYISSVGSSLTMDIK